MDQHVVHLLCGHRLCSCIIDAPTTEATFKSMTTNPSVSQKNAVHYAAPDSAAAMFNSTVSTSRGCVSVQNSFVAMAELERLKIPPPPKKNPGCNELSVRVNVFLVLKRERDKERERESLLAHRSGGDQLKDWGILGTTT